MRSLAAVLTVLLAGCAIQDQQPSPYCSSDAECGSGGCTRAQICSPSPAALTIHWTVNGVTPSLAAPGDCTAIGDLQLDIAFKTQAALLRYAPVPCAAGQSRIDNLPLDQLTMVGLTGVSSAAAGSADASAAVPRPGEASEYDITVALTH